MLLVHRSVLHLLSQMDIERFEEQDDDRDPNAHGGHADAKSALAYKDVVCTLPHSLLHHTTAFIARTIGRGRW